MYLAMLAGFGERIMEVGVIAFGLGMVAGFLLWIVVDRLIPGV